MPRAMRTNLVGQGRPRPRSIWLVVPLLVFAASCGSSQQTATTTGGVGSTTTGGVGSTTTLVSQSLTWDWVVADKQWGDPDVAVSATASSKGSVTYSTTSDACSVDGAKGVVVIDNVGTCTITASQAGNAVYQPADAELSFEIEKAQPVITFSNGSVTFRRGNPTFELWAESDPPIPLTYLKVDSAPFVGGYEYLAVNAVVCDVQQEQGTLTLFDLIDGEHPFLTATCAVEASAKGTQNYDPPEPVVALIDVKEPPRNLSVVSVSGNIVPGGEVTVTFDSPEGNIYGVDLFTYDDAVCGVPWEASPGYPSIAGKTKYTVVVGIASDAAAGQSCKISATANPLDHGEQGDIYADIVLTVVAADSTG